MAAAVATPSSILAYRVAIVGGGVAGCSAARRLAQLSAAAEITLYEMGRGPGGRASTRRTRSVPHIFINHGAPYADLRSKLGRSLVSSLGERGVASFDGVRAFLDATTGRVTTIDEVRKEDEEVTEDDSTSAAYVTGANEGEMSQIASSLLSSSGSEHLPRVTTRYKTMVRGLTRHPTDHTWELRDKSGRLLGTADWLVVAGSAVAHPRWSDAFGGAPPLVAAEAAAPDARLRAALAAISRQRASPVLAVFFACSGDDARRWRSVDFQVADVEGSAVLSRIVVQRGQRREAGDEEAAEEEWCSVVLHSTEEFALQNSGVYGSSSTAARVGDAATDTSAERSLIKKMIRALEDIPNMPSATMTSGERSGTSGSSDTLAASLSGYSNTDGAFSEYYDYGPVLHRWGNAFPKGAPLSEDLAFLSSSRIAFCGDYVATPSVEHGKVRLGSFESALLSGMAAGENIAGYYNKQ